MFSIYHLRITDLYDIDLSKCVSEKHIEVKSNAIIELKQKSIIQKEMLRLGIYFFDKLGYLIKPINYYDRSNSRKSNR